MLPITEQRYNSEKIKTKTIEQENEWYSIKILELNKEIAYLKNKLNSLQNDREEED